MGQTQNIAILTVDIRDPGKKEVEDLLCEIIVKDATLVEHKVVGLPPVSQVITSTASTFRLQAPFLNPDEMISIQLLLALGSDAFSPPEISVRGKGITGKKVSSEDSQQRDIFLPLFAAAAFSLVPAGLYWGTRRWLPQLFFTKRHLDDQREVFAYIYGINGLYEEAAITRTASKELSYWSESDFLVERCLRSGNQDLIKQGIKALEQLLNYASIQDTSCLIIHFNIARLAAAIYDLEKAKENIALARKGTHQVIERRIQFDETLSEIALRTPQPE